MHDIWNPWHGCVKYSEGCANCYMYALDARRGVEKPSNEIYKTNNFDYPLKKNRQKQYKLQPGERIRVNMTSDTFLEQADPWRPDLWKIIRTRSDLIFWILTKRVERISQCLPDDWNDGYKNVILNITTENQRTFDQRWPIFAQIPARAKGLCCAPLLSELNITQALESGQILEVSAGGENYDNPRPSDYSWYESLSRQCETYHANFSWYETGTKLIAHSSTYNIPYKHDQGILAGLAGLNRIYPKNDILNHLTLRDPVTHEVLTRSDLKQPLYNPMHCLNCGNQDICNSCNPGCKNRDPNYRLVTKQELKQLETAWKQQYLRTPEN